jgi:hypothetical protein
LQRLNQKVRRINAARPLPPVTLPSLRAWLRVETTYTSNALEGNVLTRPETTLVLDGLTIGGKPLRDHLEALDHAEAFDYMYDLAPQDTSFTEADLRELHHLVLRRLQPDHAGRYRDGPVWIGGAVHLAPPPALVPFHDGVSLQRIGDLGSRPSGASHRTLSWPAGGDPPLCRRQQAHGAAGREPTTFARGTPLPLSRPPIGPPIWNWRSDCNARS